jgi:NAD(P)-dependent dehydrogenase (short-subunit alcohol dehydrogenase family)
MKEKVVLVTGGGTGIGKAIAQKFLDLGAFVVITGRREAVLSDAVKELGNNSSYIVSDMAEIGIAKKILKEIINKHGQLDVIVNNAGVATLAPIIDAQDEDIEALFKTNLFAPLSLIREAIPELSKTKGSIINISSTLSKAAMPETSVYSASKAAIDHTTRTLAVELGSQGIRVNAVAPGPTATDMNKEALKDQSNLEFWENLSPFGRIGHPDEIASVVTFLASEEAGWVTGQIVQAGGGVMV